MVTRGQVGRGRCGDHCANAWSFAKSKHISYESWLWPVTLPLPRSQLGWRWLLARGVITHAIQGLPWDLFGNSKRHRAKPAKLLTYTCAMSLAQ